MSEKHYLHRELNELVRQDARVFEFLQAGSLDGLWYWDLTRPEQEWMSPRFKAVFGYEDHEIPNTSQWWQDNIFEEDLPGVLETAHAHLDDPDVPYDQIVRYRHKDGSTVWVRCRGIAIRDAQGKPVRMLGCHTDVTALKRTELELQEQNTQLERAHAELSEFVYATSHDIRAPLRTIHSYTELVQEVDGHNLSPLGHEYLSRVLETTEHLQSLLTAMLDVSRQGHATLKRQDLDFSALLDRVEARLREPLLEADAQILRGPMPDIVRADPTHLERILQNLISNAIKYRRRGVPPRIEVRVVPNERGGWRVEVEDNGTGIEPRYHERVFGMFERIHSQGRVQGHGLGLPLVRKLARLHGGDAWVESSPQLGSTFHVSLS